MLQLRPNCECCDKDLPPDSTEARICSFECTFCVSCAEGVLHGMCPNCGGELLARPRLNTRAARAVAHGEALARIEGESRFAVMLRHGSMSVELYAPVGRDPQEPHAQDELYVVATGTATLRIGEVDHPLEAGSVAFVAAGEDHRFEQFSDDFSTWVVFWGPAGGEQ